MNKPAEWPLVAPNDDGIRPAGPPDECFYCRGKVGQPHARDCVVVTKTVRVRYSVELELTVPHHWKKEDLEFHRNEGSWCANNALDELHERFDGDGQCMCGAFTCEYLSDADVTPRRELREPDRGAN